MRRSLFSALVLALVSTLAVAEPLDLTLPTVDGRTLSLSSLRGRWVVVNVWATWCAPCRKEMPAFDVTASKYEGVVRFVGVNLGDVIGDMNSRRGQIQGTDTRGNAQTVDAMVPLANMFGYVNQLRSFTQGRASYSMSFSHYEEVPQNVADEVKAKMA